ncbi:MAG: hypothetical protein Kow0042_20580 [Calditrichia bacterium]
MGKLPIKYAPSVIRTIFIGFLKLSGEFTFLEKKESREIKIETTKAISGFVISIAK